MSVQKTHEELHRTLAAEAFAEHQVIELSRDGVYRSWLCGKPGTRAHSFVVTTIPGRLIVTGDVGDLIVERLYDMLPWARRSIDSTNYFFEKVPGAFRKRVYEPDLAREFLQERLQDAELEPKHRDRFTEMLEFDELSESEVHEALLDAREDDLPNLRAWSSNLLWCREAVRWFLAHHEEPPEEPPD